MYVKQALFVLMSAWLVSGQRPSFAGTKPIGVPAIEKQPSSDGLGNRFGDDVILPIEAKGDRDLVERISKLPVDAQPFWYINWKALEENRKNPQTYQPKPNSFVPSNQNSDNINANSNPTNTNVNSGSADLTSKFGQSNSGFPVNNGNNRPNNNYGNYRNSRRV